MIRTLRITSITAVIAAVVLLICAAVFGVRGDPQVEDLLKQPGAVEKFASDKGNASARDESQSSPLVKQAADFARYLNPPPPPEDRAMPSVAAVQEAAPLAPVSAKFDLVGTSYYANRPELSLALIDEPGKGLHWVRQGNSVGRLVIEKVNDGSITVLDGQRTFEMSVPVQEPWRELIKGAADDRPASSTTSPAKGRITAGQQHPGTPTPPTSPPATPTGRTPPSRGRQADLAALRRVGRETQTTTADQPHQIPKQPPAVGPDQPTETPETNVSLEVMRRRIMEEAKSSQITPEEARQMELLAEQLKQIEESEQQQAAANSRQPDANSAK